MNAEQRQAFEEKIYAFIGKEASPATRGHDSVNQAMIRHWCEVMGDHNPVYTDEDYANSSAKSGIIAPPAMLQAWSLDGYGMANISDDPAQLDTQRTLHKVFDEHGFTGVLGTNCTQEYTRDLKPGDTVVAHTTIESISEQKATARGIGYFIETVTSFSDQNEQPLGRMVFRVLKFIPNDSNNAVQDQDDSTPKAATRIPSPRGFDNAWWWDGVESGKLLIQRCTNCQTLRHPPRSMCGTCQSLDWDSIESTMQGEIFSFTQLHYPKFPGYQYPLVCAVISLEEGTRIVSNIVGCAPEQIKIGQKVKGKIEQVDADTMLPQFYLV